MIEYTKLFIDGVWADPVEPRMLDVENPATQEVCGRIAIGSAADVNKAVAAARRAFPSFSRTSVAERLDLLQAIRGEFMKRYADIAGAITMEMGAPASLASMAQAGAGIGHLDTAIEILKSFPFETMRGTTMLRHEPIGVCGLITPWNWPINQVAVKVYPALATGCTMVLKPSEVSPLSAQIFAEVLEAAGVPAGVFNMVQGDGPGVGAAISAHPDIDMVSFTGSTRAGVEVARQAAGTVKRVSQELGGKSASIILDDALFAANVASGVAAVMLNSGQSCNAPTRMMVPRHRHDEAIAAAREAGAGITVGDPTGDVAMGPVVSNRQFDVIQSYIRKGIEEGATLIVGGEGLPEGIDRGYFVQPTVFAGVTNDMTIAREEIFGPVLAILPYDDVDHAVAMANDSDYGLAGYVNGSDPDVCRAIARDLRAGLIVINSAYDMTAPFGGYKRSGNGREWGDYGFHEYLEVKSIPGYGPGDSA